MPLKKEIKKVLVIGSGPIVIGQAAEFDYAGTQACRSLKEEGLFVVLVNSNPATIMTDKNMADKIYVEPLNIEVLKRVILLEKPDSVLPTLGGQTGLNLAMELAEEGFFEQNNVTLLGANPETIRKAEDRQDFKDTMQSINEPCIASKVITDVEAAVEFAEEIDYPVIVRPGYTLGGTGGGIAYDEKQLRDICTNGLRYSRVNQALIEKCISGWKEIEFEVMRDAKGNAITICSMENIDPVGVHTGDSIVVAPAMTLNDHEYQILRTSALNIINSLGIEGGCNVQFAVHPTEFEYAVIEVNPRVSRSSALASKATGYPIARVASKIAIGYSLDEIKNVVTGETYACFEPSVDYCVLKFPKWPFDKFVYAKRLLGTQMKATGEVMSIAPSFEMALMKAVRSAEVGATYMQLKKLSVLSDGEIAKSVEKCDDERIFVIAEALRRECMSVQQIYDITMIDKWFLDKIKNLIDMEKDLKKGFSAEKYEKAKKLGFLDETIAQFTGAALPKKRTAAFKMVDTCAGEFSAKTPYYYSTWDTHSEAKQSDKKTILVLGSGPIRIGQGIEFDYCSVHCVWALKKLGYEAIIMNNNPETVSTDFDTSDRLYFDPLTPEDLDNVIDTEKPDGIVVQFGGQTAIKLTKHLKTRSDVKIIGTPIDSIDRAEDRERFDQLLTKLDIPRPQGDTVKSTEEALIIAGKLGYPVLLRPSYVLGGQNMIIAYTENDIIEYMEIINRIKQENPILIDKYLMGKEVEVDAICDGKNVLIPGIMEHLERAGVHSGDSISVYPAISISQSLQQTIIDYTVRISKELDVQGLVNIQYVIYNNKVYVIEVNPRSSRTVPYISKVTNVQMVDIATRCAMGISLAEQGYSTGLHPIGDYVAVKVPVFSFEKLHDVDTQLGPEMKSTGEVLGIAKTFSDALLKGLIGAGFKFKHGGAVFISVRDEDKQEMLPVAEKFIAQGFKIYASANTALFLHKNMVAADTIKHTYEDEENNVLTLLLSGKVDYVISTSKTGRQPERESVQIRRKSVERAIPCLTSLDTANALIDCIAMNKTIDDIELVNIVDV